MRLGPDSATSLEEDLGHVRQRFQLRVWGYQRPHRAGGEAVDRSSGSGAQRLPGIRHAMQPHGEGHGAQERAVDLQREGCG
eukprot:1420055-Lingulodinium_polyedra.AAC.1